MQRVNIMVPEYAVDQFQLIEFKLTFNKNSASNEIEVRNLTAHLCYEERECTCIKFLFV